MRIYLLSEHAQFAADYGNDIDESIFITKQNDSSSKTPDY